LRGAREAPCPLGCRIIGDDLVIDGFPMGRREIDGGADVPRVQTELLCQRSNALFVAAASAARRPVGPSR
jgi:hypothetical protein